MPIFGLQPSDLLQTVFEEIGVAVAVIDRKGKLAFANRTALDLLGLKKTKGAIDFQEWRRNYYFEDSLGQEISLDNSFVIRALRGEQVEAQEVKARLPDGTIRWLLAWAYPFFAMGLAGVLSLVVDETKDVELRRTAYQLQRMETLGALAAGLTHDLNNILDTIALNVELALTQSHEGKEIQVRLNRISSASLKAGGLVKRLMQFSRSEPLEYQPVQVNELVKDALNLVDPLIHHNVIVNTSLQSGLPVVNGDILQLEQALINLIVNALDAMPDGGELRILTAKGTIAAANKNANQESVCITVSDTGIGIADELQSAVFEPFFTTKPAGKGTGLGLSSTYGIVKQHRGEIKVQSVVGAGSVFVISLPIWKARVSEQAARQS